MSDKDLYSPAIISKLSNLKKSTLFQAGRGQENYGLFSFLVTIPFCLMAPLTQPKWCLFIGRLLPTQENLRTSSHAKLSE